MGDVRYRRPYDRDGAYEYVNRSAERLLGYTADEIVGRHVSDIIPEERRDELTRINARVAQGETVPPYETERLAKDGTRVPVSLSVSRVSDANGQVVALSATYRDLRALLEERERYRSLFENDPVPVFTIDDSGNLTEANAAAERLSGYRLDELRGASFAPLIAEEDLPRAFENLARVLSGEPRVDDYALVTKQGERRRIRVTAIPIRVRGRVVGMHGRAQELT